LLCVFPRLFASDLITTALSQVLDQDLLPILAHPERYSACSVPAVRHWKSLGAKMQVDATTVRPPQARGQRARQLVAEGLADILAGDNHGDERTVATGARFLLAQDGSEQVELPATLNPGATPADRPLTPVPPLRIRQSWMRRIKEFLEGGP